MVICNHSWSLVVTRGHSWSFVVTRGHSCVLLDTIELVRFIRSGLARNLEVPLCSSDQDTQVRISKRLLTSSVSSPDRCPQAKKNLYKDRSTPKKSLNFLESTPPNATNKENTPLFLPNICHKQSKVSLENIRGII